MSDARPVMERPAYAPVAHRRTGRRCFVLALGGVAATACAASAAPLDAARAAAPLPEPFPDSVCILVAGPQGGQMDRWAAAIGGALAPALPQGTSLHQTPCGGADGVTAANQFEARVAPDGETVLLLPGAAPLAWLTGDPRARFDAATWLPVMAGVASGVLASRVPIGALRRGARLRVAASMPVGPELAALLGLELMGVEPVPAFGLPQPAAAMHALRNRMVDAIFVSGPDTTALLAEAAAAGAPPLFALGAADESGTLRDPLLPEVPTAAELAATLRGAPPGGLLAAAWRSAAAAAQIQFALVLPPLTPAALVAQWRRAGAEAIQTLQGSMPGVRLLGAPEANAAATAVATDAAAMLELRRWLAARFNWTPS